MEILVLQLMCGKFDGKEVASALSKMTFALASGPDTMRNAMYALGAASKVSEDCKRAADGMTPKSTTSGSSKEASGVLLSMAIISLLAAAFVVWGPLRNIGLWWKILLSPLALIAFFAIEMMTVSAFFPLCLSALIPLLLAVWWWPLADLAPWLTLWLKLLLSVAAIVVAAIIAAIRNN